MMDRELLRLLLLEIEKRDDVFLSAEIDIEGYDSEEIAYHCELLGDEGLLVGKGSGTTGGRRLVIERLTFAGHEFLEAVRNRSVWRRTLDRLDRAEAGFVLGVAREVAVSILRERLGL